VGEGGGGGGGEWAVEEVTGYEVSVVVPKLSRAASGGDGGREDCVARLVRELEGAGLLVDRVRGVPAEFIKVCERLCCGSWNSVCRFPLSLGRGGCSGDPSILTPL
jgi:hypothetical protein